MVVMLTSEAEPECAIGREVTKLVTVNNQSQTKDLK